MEYVCPPTVTEIGTKLNAFFGIYTRKDIEDFLAQHDINLINLDDDDKTKKIIVTREHCKNYLKKTISGKIIYPIDTRIFLFGFNKKCQYCMHELMNNISYNVSNDCVEHMLKYCCDKFACFVLCKKHSHLEHILLENWINKFGLYEHYKHAMYLRNESCIVIRSNHVREECTINDWYVGLTKGITKISVKVLCENDIIKIIPLDDVLDVNPNLKLK